MVFIFGGSALSVVDTMNVVQKEQNNFLVLVSTPSMAKLFSELYSPQNVFLLPTTEIVFSNPFSILKGVIKIQSKKKAVLTQLLKHYPDKVFFFFSGFNGLGSWLIKKFSTTAEIYYKAELSPKSFSQSYSLKFLIKGCFYRILYKIHFSQIRVGEYCMLGVSDKFLMDVKARKYQVCSDMKYIQNLFQQAYTKFSKIKILVLVRSGSDINPVYYCNLISEILQRLVKFIDSDEIGVKAHPGHPMPEFELPAGCIMLPQDAPANLIMLNCRVVVSYASATLFEAANNGKKAISLLKILKPVSLKHAEAHKKYLITNSTGEIAFPETINDLLQDVKNELSTS